MSHVPPADIRHDVVELIPALRHFALRFVKDAASIDDLVQETLLKAIAASDSFQPGTRLKSWLFTIMRNQFCTLYARQKRMVVGLDGVESWVPPSNATQEWSLRGRELEGALSRLSDDHRIVVDHVLVQGKSYEEVAVLTGCAIGTIKSRVSRAREKLALALGDDVGDAMNI